ncbi:extracellular solute-binding protein [Candidatus Curtissbacteria bacterium]|nr:extracellular solute-binding protein [Candidatus Curtissbacteria bacterium]
MPTIKAISNLKLLLPVVFLPLLALFLSACSLIPQANKNQPLTLKFWGLWESSTTMNTVIADYKKLKPNVTIVYEKKSPQQYRESLESQIQSAKGPDVFYFHNTWTPMLKEELSPVPSSVISASDFTKNYYPTARADLINPAKKLVGIPMAIDGLALYYNQDILESAGVTTPPQTWQELAQVAAKVTVRDTAGNIKTAGVAMGTAANINHFSDILGMMILQNGGDPKSPQDKAASDALEYYANFAKGVNRVWDETMPSSTVAFAGGNLAMYFGPSWRAIEIKNANPLLKFKVVAPPQLDPLNPVGWASYWAVGVSAKSQSQAAALDFMKFLTQESTLIKLYTEAAKSPGRIFGEPYPLVSLGSKLSADPILGAYIESAPSMRSFPMASFTWDNGLNDQIIKAYEDAVNAVAGGTPATTALGTTAKNVQTILNRYTAPAAR